MYARPTTSMPRWVKGSSTARKKAFQEMLRQEELSPRLPRQEDEADAPAHELENIPDQEQPEQGVAHHEVRAVQNTEEPWGGRDHPQNHWPAESQHQAHLIVRRAVDEFLSSPNCAIRG